MAPLKGKFSTSFLFSHFNWYLDTSLCPPVSLQLLVAGQVLCAGLVPSKTAGCCASAGPVGWGGAACRQRHNVSPPTPFMNVNIQRTHFPCRYFSCRRLEERQRNSHVIYPHALFSCDFFWDFPSLVNTNLHRCYYFPLDSVFKPLSAIQIYSGLLDSFSGGQGAASKPPLPPPLVLHLCKDSCSWKEVITTQKTPTLPPAVGWWQRTR